MLNPLAFVQPEELIKEIMVFDGCSCGTYNGEGAGGSCKCGRRNGGGYQP
jgi:hypothetical protein